MADNLLQHIVRIGKVSSVNTAKRTARVTFPALGNMVSGDLPVLQRLKGAVVNDVDEQIGKLGTWMPEVGQTVVCLYIPSDDADGFILGGL